MVVLSVAVPQKEVSITGRQADPISRLAAGGPRPMEGPMAGRPMPLWSPQMTNPWVSTGWPIDMMTSSNRNISRVTGPLCVSNHLRIDCLLNRLFRRRSKKTSKSLAFVREIHRWQLTLMTSSWRIFTRLQLWAPQPFVRRLQSGTSWWPWSCSNMKPVLSLLGFPSPKCIFHCKLGNHFVETFFGWLLRYYCVIFYQGSLLCIWD